MEPPILGRDFYESRRSLTIIRQHALKRNTSPDAVLHTVLARVAAFSPANLLIPGFVGGEAPLNYFAAIVAPSGGGKSTASGAGREALPAPEHLIDRDNRPIGTGEGMIESFFEKDPDTKEKVQVHHNLFVYVDEGETFARLGQRDGTTLDTVIRSAFSGGMLGQQNATRATTRILPANSYSLGMTVGYQPEKAGALLAQSAGGTPQRFMWAYAGLAGITDAELDEAYFADLPRLYPKGMTERTGQMKYPEDVVTYIRKDRIAVARGEKRRPVLDSHEPLHLLRAAALLALLEGRIAVTDEDWNLSWEMWRTSRLVRGWVQEEVRLSEEAEEHDRHRRAQATATAQALGRQYATEGMPKVRSRVIDLVGKAGPEGIAISHVKRELSPQQKLLFPDATGGLIRDGYIEFHPDYKSRLRLAVESESWD